ncbi:MAG TPA: tetratricopeptide repeat protein [Verrucomicrobiae bacterium]
MKTLEMPDSHYVSAAVGWLGLGNWQEANDELNLVAPEFRTHPAVQQVRWQICAKAERWEMAAEIAKDLRRSEPGEPQHWLNLAYATRRTEGGGLDSAREILAKAHKLFPKEPIIAYNLACYECQLGQSKKAWKRYQKALELGDSKALKRMALEDNDLEPLWPEIREK